MTAEEQKESGADSGAADEPETTAAAEAKPKRTRRAAAPTSGRSASATPRASRAKAAPRARASGAASRGRASAEAPAEAVAEAAAPSAPPKREKRQAAQRTLPRLQARYRDEIKKQMFAEFGYTSSMQVPQVSKVIINVGLGEALTNARAMETTPGHLGMISGQKPVITKAKRSVAAFKVREGQSIGVMVTMRGRRMYEFLDRMISMALPRIRDFRGVPRRSFDGKGNYSLGLREQIMFPEIDYGTVDRVRGLQVTITTTAGTDPEGFRLLELMGMPFAREDQIR